MSDIEHELIIDRGEVLVQSEERGLRYEERMQQYPKRSEYDLRGEIFENYSQHKSPKIWASEARHFQPLTSLAIEVMG